jgi:hypothetical protein
MVPIRGVTCQSGRICAGVHGAAAGVATGDGDKNGLTEACLRGRHNLQRRFLLPIIRAQITRSDARLLPRNAISQAPS